MSYRKTVAGVIYQDKEFFLVQKVHWNGKWDFPQGGMDAGESLEDALIREMSEELGTGQFGEPINTNIIQKRRFSAEATKHYSDRRDGFIGKELFYFIVPFLGNRDDITLGDDLSDKKWCDEEELLESIYQEQLNETKQILQFMKSNKVI